MSRYTTFIHDRLDEDTTIPTPVKTALRTIASNHNGYPHCHGCGNNLHDGSATDADECEDAAAVAAIWKGHPDYPA